MLYSILPPIIVILSFIALLVFLFRKASKVTELRDLSGTGESDFEKKNFIKRVAIKSKLFFQSSLRVWLWSVLEKLTRRFRMGFLKLENSFSKISNRIREKKNGKKREVMLKNADKISAEAEKEPSYNFSSFKKNLLEENISKEDRKPEPVEFKDKPVRPIISDKMVSPRNRSEIKDILENVLIERIAANPKDVEAYERLGEYYMEIGNYEHAKECVRQIIKLNPANKSAKYKMKRLERLMNG